MHNKSSLQVLTATLNPGSALASRRQGTQRTQTFPLKNYLGRQKVWVESLLRVIWQESKTNWWEKNKESKREESPKGKGRDLLQ